MLNIGVSAAK